MKYKDLYTIVNNIIDIKKDVIVVDLEIYNDNEYITSNNIELDLRKMGLNNDMDYEFQLSKDLNNFVVNFYNKNNELPNIESIQKEFYNKNYLIIENPDYIRKSNKEEPELEIS